MTLGGWCLCLFSLTFVSREWSVSGPGLTPDKVILPCRYFFITSSSPDEAEEVSKGDLEVSLMGRDDRGGLCRPHHELMKVTQGQFLVRYKLYYNCNDLDISVKIRGRHIEASPVTISGPSLSDSCHCPLEMSAWLDTCPASPASSQMESDLARWIEAGVDMEEVVGEARRQFSEAGSQCWCHYAVEAGQVYRQCHGQHTGFRMFWDSVLGWLTRRARLPDLEIIVNLGDWPLAKLKGKLPVLPMVSWCGSGDTGDLLVPTYDLTESSLECMGRQSLDILAALGKNEVPWEEKTEKMFWRGRDSSRERLQLVRLGAENPDLIDAGITAFFFFRDEMSALGRTNHTLFFDFFDHKYQLCLDGTVAAYRLPYLLAGGSAVFKQESNYFEHFYKDLKPWQHFIPVKRDLSDILDQIKWAKDNDAEVRKIAENARNYVIQNLLPDHVLCYYGSFLQKWSELMKNEVRIGPDMELVNFEKSVAGRFPPCACSQEQDDARAGSQADARSEPTTKDEL